MKIIIHLSFICLFFAACSKGDSTPTPAPAPPIPDTLTTGWTKTGAGIPSTGVSDVYFTGVTTGFATTGQGIFKSTDGGINWSLFNPVNNTFNIGGLGNRYCFVGNDNRIHYTNDGNDFFSNAYWLANPGNPPLTLGFKDCFVASASVLYACSGRYVYKSVNGGANFDSVFVFPDGTTTHAVFFTSITEGWVIRSTGLYKTTNGGSNWSLVSTIGNVANYGSVDFLSTNIGVVSDANKVYKTTDGGVNWSPIFSSAYNSYIDVDIISANEIYLAAGDRIYKTVNGGANWTQVLTSMQNGIVEVHFIDSNTGWACGGNGAVYRYKQ